MCEFFGCPVSLFAMARVLIQWFQLQIYEFVGPMPILSNWMRKERETFCVLVQGDFFSFVCVWGRGARVESRTYNICVPHKKPSV